MQGAFSYIAKHNRFGHQFYWSFFLQDSFFCDSHWFFHQSILLIDSRHILASYLHYSQLKNLQQTLT